MKILHREPIELQTDKFPAPALPVEEPIQEVGPRQLQHLKAQPDPAKRVMRQGVLPIVLPMNQGGIEPLYFGRPRADLVIEAGLRLPKQKGGTKQREGPLQ